MTAAQHANTQRPLPLGADLIATRLVSVVVKPSQDQTHLLDDLSLRGTEKGERAKCATREHFATVTLIYVS